MNAPETINIEKYANALNELIGIDSAYLGDSDKNVNAIIEVIVAAKKLENRVKELEAEKDALIKNYAQCMKDYAREIFKEFENLFKTHCIEFDMSCTDIEFNRGVAKLEKKYVEGIV